MSGFHQNAPVNITILIVDDDYVASSAISHTVRHLKNKDKSIGEIKVITARDWSEAIITFSVELNKINLLIIDYHILDLNIIQLKEKIYEEFGNLPIIVMSSNMKSEIEQEIASLGGINNLGFITKPIEEENELASNLIKKYALKSNLKDHISHWCYTEYEKTILYPDKTVLDPSYDVRMESRRSSQNNKSVISRRNRKRVSKEKISCKSEKVAKPKIRWSHDLRHKFLEAVRHLGIHKAVPKKILQYMNDANLTRENIASHLQKYRNFLKKIRENSQMMSQIESNRIINTNFASSSQQFNNYNPNLTNVGLHEPFNYLNQRLNRARPNQIELNQIRPNQIGPNQIGPNLLSGWNTNVRYLNGITPSNEERGSFFDSSQGFYDHRLKKYNTTNSISNMNFNTNIGYGGFNIDFGGPKYNNGIIGESSSSMNNWTYNNNNMNNIIGTPCGMTNSHIDHNQHHQNGENLQEVLNGDFLEGNSIFSLSHIENGSFDNGNSNEQTSNLTDDDLEIYCPIRDNNNINLERGGVGVDERPNQDLDEDEFVESLFSKDMS